MKIPKEIIENIMEGDMKKVWNTFINLESEYKEFQQDYQDIRYGITVEFDIYDLWEDTKQIIRKDKDRIVIINNRIFSLSDFRTEKEERRKRMIQAILENVLEMEVIEAR